MTLPLDQRPVIVALAGPNGAGKTTFFYAHLREAALRFIEPDKLAKELKLDPYPAARLADKLREQLLGQRESFVFETVFSDPMGEKLGFLKKAASSDYNVILCFIGISSPTVPVNTIHMSICGNRAYGFIFVSGGITFMFSGSG